MSITIERLERRYGDVHALKGIDLTIRTGGITGLLGPNGAGKTTLIGVVCGLVRPTSGTVIADGHDITRDYRSGYHHGNQHQGNMPAAEGGHGGGGSGDSIRTKMTQTEPRYPCQNQDTPVVDA